MEQSKEVLLEIKDYTVEFHTETGVKQAINHLNLTIHKGESLGLVGEAGAGKTTTALSILRLLPKHSAKIKGGTITFGGQNMAKLSQRELRDIRGSQISMIFQNPLTSLNPVFTVGEQVAMVLRRHRGMSNSQALKEAGNLMEVVGIARERIKDYPHQFSGGMRQRIGIAAALACNPELLIADEPTTALDVTIQAQIMQLLKELQKDLGMAVILITHDIGLVAQMADRVLVMYAGQIIEQAPVLRLFDEPGHPYTQALLRSVPSIPRFSGSREEVLAAQEADGKRLESIQGVVPEHYDRITGCRFADRCPYEEERCHEPQEEVACGPAHVARCWKTARLEQTDGMNQEKEG